MEACPGAGSCQGLYTANTMACLTETLGMSLPGCGTALAVSSKKRRIAQASGVPLAWDAALLMPFYYVSPYVGWAFDMKSFIIVVLGGMGSVPGTLLGGVAALFQSRTCTMLVAV